MGVGAPVLAVSLAEEMPFRARRIIASHLGGSRKGCGYAAKESSRRVNWAPVDGCRLLGSSGSGFAFCPVSESGEEWLVVDGGAGWYMSVAFGESVLVLRVLWVVFGGSRLRFCGIMRGREVFIFM